MSVNITFQSRDWHPRNAATEDELHIVAAGVDLDHGIVTVYTDEESGDNLTLAVAAPYQNENGDECGNVGWRIEPSELLREFPELAPVVGWVFGRVIITEIRGDMAVDHNRNDYVLLRDKREPLSQVRARRRSELKSTPKPLVQIVGGVGEVVHGDVTVIDFDDWNDDDGDPEARRREIIRDIQRAGYRCVVSDGSGSVPDIRIFPPDANYEAYITEQVRGPFAVYDPEDAQPKPVMDEVFTIVVRSEDGRDLTPELASHPSIDGAADKARQGKPLGSLANLDPDNALTAVCQIIDQGHEWTTDSEAVVQPLRDRMSKFVHQEQGGLAECVTPDGWQVYVFRFIEEVQS